MPYSQPCNRGAFLFCNYFTYNVLRMCLKVAAAIDITVRHAVQGYYFKLIAFSRETQWL